MKKTLLTAVSAIALTVSAPSFAEINADAKANVQVEANTSAAESSGSFKKDVKDAWENTKEDVSEAADKVSGAVTDTYEDAKQAFKDDDDTSDINEIVVNERMTAQGIIGQPVYNTNGERIAKVRDIIVNGNGKATMVVLGDGDFTGLGKLAAFDYSVIMNRQTDGDVVVALTEESIDKAARFSYDRLEQSETTRVIPGQSYSVAKILDAVLTSPDGETLAEVDNVLLRDGNADQLIISYDQFMGLGGEKLAIPFHEAEIVEVKGALKFKLSAAETAQFRKHTTKSKK
jgi:sporulation protein YlmC with PRC-barrel domain|tara:strand:- start:1061 stop:1924 length:864 start_codon:yes stop_codon:yes gene_type:complete